MGQKYCTSCGTAVKEGKKFCEQCGSPVADDSIGPASKPAVPEEFPAGKPLALPIQQRGNTIKFFFIPAAILLVAAAVVLFVLPGLPGTGPFPGGVYASTTTSQTPVPAATVMLPPASATTSIPTPGPDPFPGALNLKDKFSFGSGSVASEATVYRIWINDTYEWHNDNDNRYYIEKPRAGNKFLFVFVHLQNNGDYRVWFPPAANIIVNYHGVTYTEDQSHYKPDKGSDEEATPIEVKEVMYFHKLNGDEYVEDFGFSHGTELAYLYPGISNAVDGYIVYQVPRSLTPEETYVAIPFNAQDQGVWKLG